MRVLSVLLLAAVGCGPSGPKTHPVEGRVTLAGGDAKRLAGHHLEVVLEGDPSVRASGVIGGDGAFGLETLHAGEILKGVPEGKYRVRVLRAEEGDDGKRLPAPPVAAKYLKFESSGLTLSVPPPGPVTFDLAPR